MTADETAAKEYTSMDVAAHTAYEQYMDRQMDSQYSHRGCFICEFQERYQREVSHNGGQTEVLLAGSLGYKLLLNFYASHPWMDDHIKAYELTEIYRIHVWEPARKAGAQRNFPYPDERVFLQHLLIYNFDPVAIELRCIKNMRMLAMTLASRIEVNGSTDLTASRLFKETNMDLHKMVSSYKKGGETAGAAFTLDREKVMAFAGIGPIAEFAERTKDVLGGATATNADAAMRVVTAQRPAFGSLSVESSVMDEGDDEDS